MTIEYIKNVTVVSANTSNFSYNASIMAANPPDEVIIRQISYVPDSGTVGDGEIFMLHSDLNNDYIGTMVMKTGQSVTNSNITLKLKQPLTGNINFKVDSIGLDGVITTEPDNGVIVINMDFIKRK